MLPSIAAVASIDERRFDDHLFGLAFELMRDAAGLVIAIERAGDLVFERHK